MKHVSVKKLRFAILATDVVLFAVIENTLKVLLMTAHRPPHIVNMPAFPGGVIRPDETAQDASERHLQEKGGIAPEHVHLEQLYTFSGVNRDPRGRVVSVAYLGLIAPQDIPPQLPKGVSWQDADDISVLAYDHNEIFAVALERLRAKAGYTTIIKRFMPREFTLTELQRAYEIVLGRALDKRNFRKNIVQAGLVRPIGNKTRGGAHRPAALFTFTHHAIQIVKTV